jgi:hypothetical protein
MTKSFLYSIIRVVIFCVIIIFVTSSYIHNAGLIGFVILGLGVLSLVFLKLWNVSLSTVWPDIVFGMIDNGILVIVAEWGGAVAGVTGAIIGGVVGNALTDGIAGLFEGYIAERMRANKISDKRTVLGSAVGKMGGCLLGAGVVLIFFQLLNF